MNFNLLNRGSFSMSDPRIQSFESASLRQLTQSGPLTPSSPQKPVTPAQQAVSKLSELLNQQSAIAKLPPGNQDLLAFLLEIAGDYADYLLSDKCLGALDETAYAKAMELFGLLFPLDADGRHHSGPHVKGISMFIYGSQSVNKIGQSVGDYFTSLNEVVKTLGGEWINCYWRTCDEAADWQQEMPKIYACFERLAKASPDTFGFNNSLFRDFKKRPNAVEDFECIIANLGTDQGWGVDRLKDFQAMLHDYAHQYGSRDELIDMLLLDIRTGTDLGELSAEYLRARGIPTSQPAQDPSFEQVLSMDRDARTPIVMRQGETLALYADGKGSRTWTLLESGESEIQDPLFDLSGLAAGVHHLLSSDETKGITRNPRLQTIIVLPQDAPVGLLTQLNVPEAPKDEALLRTKVKAILSRAQESTAAFKQREESLFTHTPEQDFSSQEISWYNLASLRAAIDYSLIVKDEQGQEIAYDNTVWKAYVNSLTAAVNNCGCGNKNGTQNENSQNLLANQIANVQNIPRTSLNQPESAVLSQPIRQVLEKFQPKPSSALHYLLDERYYALMDQIMKSNEHYAETQHERSQTNEMPSNVAQEFSDVQSRFQRWLDIT